MGQNWKAQCPAEWEVATDSRVGCCEDWLYLEMGVCYYYYFFLSRNPN